MTRIAGSHQTQYSYLDAGVDLAAVADGDHEDELNQLEQLFARLG